MKERSIPVNSLASQYLATATFADCFEVAMPDMPSSAMAAYLQMVSKVPAWVNTLMAIRNRVVAVVGLRNVGHLGAVDLDKTAAEYQIGDRVGVFSILHLNEDEVVLIDSDRHLTAWISVCRLSELNKSTIALSTVVKNKNIYGQIYIFFVGPVHKFIVPAMLSKLNQ